MVALEVLDTLLVVTVKVTLEAPAGIVTVKGTCAMELLLHTNAVPPPDGAVPFRLNVPVEEFPPLTDVGFSVTDASVAAFTVNVLLLVVPLNVAEMLDDVDDDCPLVLIVKVVVRAPPGTVTVAGTVAAEVLLLESVTTRPADGATDPRVTVPVELFPPTTVLGLIVSDDRTGGLTVRVAVLATPNVAVMVTLVVFATPLLVTVKDAVVAPARTVTLAGTCAAAVLPLLSVTTDPPVGAAAFRVTVPVELLPPVTEVGLKDTADTEGGLTVSVAVADPP